MTCRELIEGLTILAKYEGLDADVIEFEHDKMYCGHADVDELRYKDEFGDPIYIDRRVSTEDHERLVALDWYVSEEHATWLHFA